MTPSSQRSHSYAVNLRWTGNRGSGTSAYGDYGREHDVCAGDKGVIAGSADRVFRGDPERWNPEEMLVAALSQCHLLSYLALCALDGVVVTAYEDDPRGRMVEGGDAPGRFAEVVLSPRVTVAQPEMVDAATHLHHQAHEECYIANSVNFSVHVAPEVVC